LNKFPVSRLLQLLLDGCLHRWKMHREIRLFKDGEEASWGTKYILQCRRCGKMDAWVDGRLP
jgi:hypothetical protein